MKRIIAVSILFLGVNTFAQIKEAKIKELIALTGGDKLASQAVSENIGKYQQAYPGVPRKFWEEFSKEMSPEKFAELYVPIYNKYYNETEIDELIKFYNTPLGKKVLEVMPLILKESMEAGRKMGEETSAELMKKIDAE